MELTEKEIEVLKIIYNNDYITSTKLKKIFNIPYGKKALTKNNFPNIRNKLESYNTAIHHAPYRGGYAWFSVVGWKKGYNNLKEFMTENNIIKGGTGKLASETMSEIKLYEI